MCEVSNIVAKRDVEMTPGFCMITRELYVLYEGPIARAPQSSADLEGCVIHLHPDDFNALQIAAMGRPAIGTEDGLWFSLDTETTPGYVHYEFYRGNMKIEAGGPVTDDEAMIRFDRLCDAAKASH